MEPVWIHGQRVIVQIGHLDIFIYVNELQFLYNCDMFNVCNL